MFFMLTLWAYARYARQPSHRRCAAVAVLYGLGLLCKNTLVTLPFVLLLLDWCRSSALSWSGQKAEKAGSALLGFGEREDSVVPAFGWVMRGDFSCFGKMKDSVRLPFLERIGNARGFLWHLPAANVYPAGLGHPLISIHQTAAVLGDWPGLCRAGGDFH